MILHWIKAHEHFNRKIEDDFLIFIMVYGRHYPPIEYVREHFKISQKQYDRYDNILREYFDGDNESAIESVKDYIRKNK